MRLHVRWLLPLAVLALLVAAGPSWAKEKTSPVGFELQGEIVPVQASGEDEPERDLDLEDREPEVAGGRAWLGVELQPLDETLREAFDFEGPGVLVTRVVPGSPADRAGIARSDIITRVDGRDVQTPAEASRRIRTREPGDTVKITRIRKGRKSEVEVKLVGGPERLGGRGERERESRRWTSSSYLGTRIEALGSDLASYFAVEPESGVLVISVHEDSPASRAGLKAGDVVVKIKDKRVGSPEEFMSAVQAEDPGTKIRLSVIRHGKAREIEATLAEAPPFERLRHLTRFRGEDFGPMMDGIRHRVREGRDALAERVEKLEELIRDLERRLDKREKEDR